MGILTALATSWLLDGLQVTLAGSLAGILEDPRGLGLSDPEVTAGATTYLAGAVSGAILFGYLTDRLGRRRLFLVTLATYSGATLLTAGSWNFLSFAVFRFLTGVGVGGEYAAINSAVDELIPGRVPERRISSRSRSIKVRTMSTRSTTSRAGRKRPLASLEASSGDVMSRVAALTHWTPLTDDAPCLKRVHGLDSGRVTVPVRVRTRVDVPIGTVLAAGSIPTNHDGELGLRAILERPGCCPRFAGAPQTPLTRTRVIWR